MTTLREAALLALEALDSIDAPLNLKEINKINKASNALRAALEATGKESLPVERSWQWLTFGEIADACEAGLALRLYGDLDEELVLCASRQNVVDFVRSLEAKLKEKNT